MPSATGYIDEERLEFIEQELIEKGKYEDISEVVNECVRYTLDHKHDYSR